MNKVEQIFGELLELSPADRIHRLEQLEMELPEIHAQVVPLLQAHEQAGSFLRAAGESTAEFDGAEHIGKQIRQYKLRELIGEGGMGVVYVAEQEKPLRRKVALKVIKPGMDSKAVLARFDAERQALALMNHPNIAKVLDAGTTPEGRPYFVMELVSGQPITQYCDAQKLTIRERLDLFTEVCQAIQHAHQKGIIHRDIKPSNVLVTELDGKPVAKVIDFGVAKALNQSLTEHSIYTAHQAVIGTPLYMSPEQASFSAVDVDTRSDVYSLGVLLYELLTGTTPFTNDDFKQAAQDEVFRLIREQEPPRPSIRISSLGDTATQVSSLRRTQPDQLGRTVKGDLDWIVMKALSKERGRRYDSANGLLQDVLRHMKNEPVEATPDSTLYRFKKFYRRNRVLVRTSAIVLTVVLLAITFSAMKNRELNAALKATERLNSEREAFVVQRALMKAIEGDLAAVQLEISQYPEILEGNNWAAILESSALMHAGRYSQAQEKIQPVLDGNDRENWIPIYAILAVSYMYDGHWDLGITYANKLRRFEPRKGSFYDVDLLFYGYGLMFVENDRAVEILRDVLKRNPTWLAAQSILADGLVHQGNFNGNDALIEEAFDKSSAVVSLIQENPFALDANLFATRMLVERRQLAGRPFDELHARAIHLIDRLEKYRQDFILATAMPAQYYDVVRPSKSEALWEDLLNAKSEMWRWTALGRLYWSRSSEETLAILDNLEDAKQQTWTQAARGYLLADLPGRGKEALEIFNTHADAASLNPGDTFFLIHVPLLLGERELAMKTAEKWLNNWSDASNSEWADAELLRIVASDGEYSPKNKTKLVEVLEKHIRGLLAISEGRTRDALELFDAASKKPWISMEYNWSIAFRDRCKSGGWPCENRKVRNENTR